MDIRYINYKHKQNSKYEASNSSSSMTKLGNSENNNINILQL